VNRDPDRDGKKGSGAMTSTHEMTLAPAHLKVIETAAFRVSHRTAEHGKLRDKDRRVVTKAGALRMQNHKYAMKPPSEPDPKGATAFKARAT
jgi:hypothetical protein